MAYLNDKLVRFHSWWRRPATPADRVWAVVLGAWAGLWLGAIGRLVLGEMPVSLRELAWFAVASAGVLAACGLVFPKTVRCISFPFSFLGASSGA